ncbi:PAS domain-containing sensor histidine kinase (plasmid) [Hymenobacter sp. BRD128]|uniref:sensor histidine kinase n=1 Tax=Hymenobacter sp. BRD128 TaxID=2675878 RepID=UPI001567217C|nr:PAS domain-containing sensor histidine kinase [Hymenobacter sp. BRD128]QKG59164.1 PAS domain-containing sensor histidine kinase [Hymenobacter sp. BRD128]
MAPAAPAPLAAAAFPEGLLLPLLAVSLSGVKLLSPLYDPAGALDDFALEYLNPAGQRMTGLSERPGIPLRTYFPHALAAGLVAFYRRVFETHRADTYEGNYQADGRANYFRFSARRHANWLVVSFTDIAGQPSTPVEQTRRAAAARAGLYQVFAESPALIAILRGPEHRYEYFNGAYERQFAGRQLQGRPVAEALPEAAAQGFVALLDRVYQTGETYFGQELPLALDGPDGAPAEPTYYNLTYQAYREDGQTVGISVFAYDVTRQVLAQQEREAQRRQLRELFEQAPVAIAVFRGPRYVIELANPTVCALWGRTPAQALHTPLFELLPEAAGQGFEQLLDEVMATGVPYVAHELPALIDRDGRRDTVYWNFVYQPLHEGTEISGVTVVATDVTDQVTARQQVQALNQELTSANEQLTRTNVDLDNFIYTASHDLKAPITNIEGLLYLLRAELPADVAQSEYVAPGLTHLFDAVERFKRTLNHLTEVSKLQKEHAPADTAVDLAAVVEGVRQDLAPQLRDTDAQLRVAVTGLPPVRFAEKNLRSVVYNLLSNALKYRHPARRPHVDVQAHAQASFTVLEVHDNGLGIEAAHLPRLFTMFQRFHTHVEGTGIGLFMVKRMVENAGGHLEVHSQPGAGTSFFVYLPHAPGPPAA